MKYQNAHIRNRHLSISKLLYQEEVQDLYRVNDIRLEPENFTLLQDKPPAKKSPSANRRQKISSLDKPSVKCVDKGPLVILRVTGVSMSLCTPLQGGRSQRSTLCQG